MAKPNKPTADTKNLVQKPGQSTWYVRLAVPADVQTALGCKVLKKSLQTTSLIEAQRRRGAYLSAWWDQIESARAGRRPPEGWQETFGEALQLAGEIIKGRKLEIIGVEAPSIPRGAASLEALPVFNSSSIVALQSIPWGDSRESRLSFMDAVSEAVPKVTEAHALARFTFTPEEKAVLSTIVNNPTGHKPKCPITKARIDAFKLFRETRGGEAKHVAQQVRRVKNLKEFLTTESLPLSFDAVDKWIVSLNKSPATINQHLMAGNAFWKWAIRYDAQWTETFRDKANPFQGHSIPKGGGSKLAGQERKAFTSEELAKLYSGAVATGKTALADLILLASYTGARIEELCQLRVADVVTLEGVQCLDITASKTKAGVRAVPVHSAISGVVARLIKASSDGFLIPTTSVNKYGKRYPAHSKAFGVLRDSLGFTPLHVFHGIRHSVVTALVRTDVNDALIKELVGHETGSITHDVYSKGSSPRQKLLAIEKLTYAFTI